MDYNVIIIGSGPAGASAANFLKKSGLNTIILEKSSHPKYKACGGLLSDNGLEFIRNNFGKLPDEIYCNVKKLKIKISKRGTNYFELPMSFASIRRSRFDLWLNKLSDTERMENTTYIAHTTKNDHIIVKLNNNGKEQELTCKYLIGADGAKSNVRVNIDENYDINSLGRFQQFVYKSKHNINENFYYFITSKKMSDGFATFGIKDGFLQYGTGYSIDNKNKYTKVLEDFLIENFGVELEEKQREEHTASALNKDGLNINYGLNNTLLIGEAAGLVTGTGTGIPSALVSGKIAAETIINNYNTNDCIIDKYKYALEDEVNYLKSTYK